ncbi:hypothetical protein M0R45_015881 [Rubus argutus]|uniref:Uncharacterized protein n=1 Tax=Rubus argutus TaxID=59490 RepID=A0AAW1XSV1_RUBAR
MTITEFGSECFKKPCKGESNKAALLQGYCSVLNSKQSEESQVNFARWEPRHGRFRFRHPWKHYLKIGSLTRQCAYRIDTLNGYINSEIQTPMNIQSNKVQELCMKMSSESGKALKELASAIKTMTRPSSANLGEDIHLLDIIPAVTIASLLTEVVTYAEQIEKSIHELASLSHVQFKSGESKMEQEQTKLHKHGSLHPCAATNGPHHVITIVQPSVKEIGSKQTH